MALINFFVRKCGAYSSKYGVSHTVLGAEVVSLMFNMAYAYGYSELYSTSDKERSESRKGSDLSTMFSVTLENEIPFDINFTCKGR